MALTAKIDYTKYTDAIRTIEAHTEGEYCRVALDCPKTEGNTMIERKHYLEEHYDYLRTALMFEPRGHHDMFGAFVVEPCNKEADFGVFFMDGGGYLNMCGHCTIGVVTAILEGGLMEMKEPQTEVVLEAPAGIIRTVADVKDGKVTGVTLTKFSSFMLQEVNKTVSIQHPELDITSVDLVENYSTTDTPDADLRNLVVFGDPADPQLDRSPCGTGTSAKMSLLHALGELPVGKEFVYESFIGTKFYGMIQSETKVGDFDAIVPQVKGGAYLCGEATWFIDPDDALGKGFVVPK